MFLCCESNSNTSGDSKIFGHNDFPKQHVVTNIRQSRRSCLLTVGTIAIIAGLLFPSSTHILDVLLIFSISLTAAVLIITFSARSALQVQGFPLLIVLATMLRMVLSVACAKLILSHGAAGTIISLFGAIFVRNNPVFTTLIFGTAALIIFGTICKTVRRISRTGTEFTTDIVPIKQSSIDSDLNAGVINNVQALNLRENIARESNFFAAMTAAAKFILCAAVIELVIVVVNIVPSIAVGAVATATSGISVKTYATLAVGAGMITQISALFIAVACGYLVRKSSAPAAVNDGIGEYTTGERIEVATKVSKGKIVQAEIDVVVEDAEWADEQDVDENEKDDLSLWFWKDAKEDDYEAIAELIESKSSDEAKTILTAAESVEDLPVTVPVNIAMRLAQNGQKCLLIDLDLERDAISKVFDIDSRDNNDKTQTKAIATCISNLCVWPASNFDENNTINLREVIDQLKSQYDRLIIYAPNVKLLADSEQVASCVQAVMLFGQGGEFESSSTSDLHKLLISYGCEVLKPVEVYAEVA